MGDSEGNEGDDTIFAKLVEARPWLYDTEHPKYRVNSFEEESWRLIANAMGWEDDEESGMTGVSRCKNTWKRLRDNYKRAMTKLPSGSGPECLIPKNPIYHALRFLRKVQDKNTRTTSTNFKQRTVAKVATPNESEIPKEKWDETDLMFEGGNNSINFAVEQEDGGKEVLLETSVPHSNAEMASTSRDTQSSVTRELYSDLTVPATTSSEPSCSKNTNVLAPKRPPPDRVNPPSDTFAKKKAAKFNKFEDMISKGSATLNTLMREDEKPSQSSSQPKSANATFCEYLLMELDALPKEKQGAARQGLILHLNELTKD